MIKSKKDKSEKENNNIEEIEIPINESDEGVHDSQVAALKEQVKELKDQYLRKLAEFENFKKRTDAEKSEIYGYANEKLLLEMLPVLDDFERVMKSYEDGGSESYKGVKLVYDKFKNILEKQGLKEMESDTKPFDVHLHEAIMQQPSEAEPNSVINTVEKGYYLKDKVLRHAKVIVSTKPQ